MIATTEHEPELDGSASRLIGPFCDFGRQIGSEDREQPACAKLARWIVRDADFDDALPCEDHLVERIGNCVGLSHGYGAAHVLWLYPGGKKMREDIKGDVSPLMLTPAEARRIGWTPAAASTERDDSEPAVRIAIVLERAAECDHAVAVNAVFSSRPDTVFAVVPTGDISPMAAMGLKATGFTDQYDESERPVTSGIDGQERYYDVSSARLPYQAEDALSDPATFVRLDRSE